MTKHNVKGVQLSGSLPPMFQLIVLALRPTTLLYQESVESKRELKGGVVEIFYFRSVHCLCQEHIF